MFYKNSLYIIFIILAIFLTPISKIDAQSQKPIKILLVPGHDDTVWGAEYGNTKEADMTLALATLIYNILKKNKKFEVYITRDKGGYTKEFADYFAVHQAEIVAFKQNAKERMKDKINTSVFLEKKNAPHHGVNEYVSEKLYGFNKWANENYIDLVLHVHFNDYPRKNNWTIGKYKGFTVYVPDSQFANSERSLNVAKNIFKQLNKKYKISNFEPESSGVVPDQKLIAIGANNTLDPAVRAVLVEYSYIYEKKFRTKKLRLKSYQDMATLTASAINSSFK